MKNTLFWALCLCPCILYGQFYDDFSQGLKAWSGDTSKFTTDAEGQLRLNDDKGGVARIYRQVEQLDTNFWSGAVKLEFQPSSANQLRLVFQATDTTMTNGWYAVIGESGQNDSLRFYSIKDGRRRLLGALYLDVFSSDDIHFDYRIYSDADQIKISIFDLLSHADSLILPADFMLPPPFLFQLQCQYTSTRASKFAFDEMAVSAFKVDTVPVDIEEIDVIASRDIAITFSEAVDSNSLGEIQIIGPTQISSRAFSKDALSLLLHTKEALISGEWYEVFIETITDLSGNRTDTLRRRFQYQEIVLAGNHDLLITEMMADPEPVRALPDCEYLELFNRTDKYLQLADYTIADLTRQAFLPDYLLAPHEYVILCDENCEALLSGFGPTIVVDDLPSLNNDADAISVVDFVGRIVHQVNYDRSWYGNSSQENGGWSLEMINPEDVCAGKKNWYAADFELCGSPGAHNTIALSETQRDTLKLVRAVAVGSHRLEVVFSHALSFDPDHLRPQISHDIMVDQIEIDQDKMSITLLDSLELGIGYQLTLSDVHDCLDRRHKEDFIATVYRPREVDSSELVINEVLFDGTSDRPEFIELHNASSSFLQIDRLCLESRSPSDTTFECLSDPLVIVANGFLVWTEDTSSLLKQYPRAGHYLEWPLPKLNDEAGQLDLFSYSKGKRTILDRASYKSDWHSPVLNDPEGVSLERRRYHVSGLLRDNWYSASSVDNFGTPGRNNSQVAAQENGKELIQLSDRSFSPNGDGHKDIMEVMIHPDKPGYNLRLDVFDLDGHFIRRLSNDDLVNGPHFFVWDGSDEDGHVRSIGVYLILLEMGHPDGDLHRQKVSVILN